MYCFPYTNEELHEIVRRRIVPECFYLGSRYKRHDSDERSPYNNVACFLHREIRDWVADICAPDDYEITEDMELLYASRSTYPFFNFADWRTPQDICKEVNAAKSSGKRMPLSRAWQKNGFEHDVSMIRNTVDVSTEVGRELYDYAAVIVFLLFFGVSPKDLYEDRHCWDFVRWCIEKECDLFALWDYRDGWESAQETMMAGVCWQDILSGTGIFEELG